MARRSVRYTTYIKSAKWRDRRRYLFALRPHKGCQRAGCSHAATECHHLHYRTLGNEALEDVEFLCLEHHELADKARIEAEEDRQARQARAAYLRALETYAVRKFGGNWRERFHEDHVETCFERHLDELDA